MKIKEAYKLAIENGWKGINPYEISLNSREEFFKSDVEKVMEKLIRQSYLCQTVLDPEFMKALGKGLGFEETFEDWAKMQMYRMVDHIDAGGSAESFIEGL